MALEHRNNNGCLHFFSYLLLVLLKPDVGQISEKDVPSKALFPGQKAAMGGIRPASQ